jgi:2-polyprenyl-3-methyl-5-hydroxy-6-metoxy-1,4-benzoquinol methylase
MSNRESLLQKVAEHEWFHAIDFGDCQSSGRRFRSTLPDNLTLFGIMDMLGHIDLTGLACLDIGAADGLIAFNMATRGARRVVATDVSRNGRPAFYTSRDLLNLDVEMFPDTTFENIVDKLGEHTFDVVVCSGIMYHMLNPFDCILKARRLLKRNGLLLFQTRHDPKEQGATLDFNPESRKLDQLNVYFVPSRSAVTGMLVLGGFQLLAIRTGTRNNFISTLACNVDLAEITDAPPLIQAQLEHGINYAEYKQDLPEPDSEAFYRGPQNDAVIDDLTFEPDFPPHPTGSKPVLGSKARSSSGVLKTNGSGDPSPAEK